MGGKRGGDRGGSGEGSEREVCVGQRGREMGKEGAGQGWARRGASGSKRPGGGQDTNERGAREGGKMGTRVEDKVSGREGGERVKGGQNLQSWTHTPGW